jgi:hypothetical protein
MRDADHRYPALAEWRRRSATTFDDLWRAACAEAAALEAAADGLPELAERYRAEARQLWSPARPTAATLTAALAPLYGPGVRWGVVP